MLYKAARAAIPATGIAQRNARPAVGSAPLFDEDPELAAEAVGEAPVLLADVPPVVPAVDPDLAVVELWVAAVAAPGPSAPVALPVVMQEETLVSEERTCESFTQKRVGLRESKREPEIRKKENLKTYQ